MIKCPDVMFLLFFLGWSWLPREPIYPHTHENSNFPQPTLKFHLRSYNLQEFSIGDLYVLKYPLSLLLLLSESHSFCLRLLLVNNEIKHSQK